MSASDTASDDTMAQRLSRGLGALTAFLGIVVGVPLLLLWASNQRFGSPFPLADIPWPWQWSTDELRSIFTSPLGEATLLNGLIRTTLCLAWIGVAIVAVTTIREVAHLIRHVGIPLPDQRGLGWCQPLARTIAVGVIALLPTTVSAATVGTSSVEIAVGALSSEDSGAVVVDKDVTPPEVRIARLEERRRELAMSYDIDELDDAAAPVAANLTASRESSATASGGVLYTVERGDSVYSIATRLANGDVVRTSDFANAILDVNLGKEMPGGLSFNNPALIYPGWELEIPGEIPAPDWATTVLAPAPESGDALADVAVIVSDGQPTITSDVDRTDGATYEVGAGDTLVGIAVRELGDPHRWGEIWDLNRDRTMSDGRTFDDPNMIQPGWSLALPAPSEPSETATETSTSTASVSDSSANRATVDQSERVTDDAVSDVTALDTTPSIDTSRSDDTTPSIDTTAPPLDTTPSDAPATPPSMPAVDVGPSNTNVAEPNLSDPATETPDTTDGTPSGRLVGAATTPALATALLAAVAVRRRRQLRAAPPRSITPERPDRVIEIERRLRPLDETQLMARVDLAVRSIGASLAASPARVGLVTVSANGATVVRLTQPVDLPQPWRTTDDRRTWRLAASATAEQLAELARQSGAPCPTLVPVGIDTDDATVMLDLEAASSLFMRSGSDAESAAFIRALAANLALSPHAEAAHLISTDLPIDVFTGHPNAHRARTAAEALDLAEQLADRPERDAAAPSTFALRALRTGGSAWAPSIALIGPNAEKLAEVADSDRLTALPAALAVVIATGDDDSLTGSEDASDAATDGSVAQTQPGALLTPPMNGRGAWTLSAFGVDVALTPVGLAPSDIDDIVTMLAHADEPPAVDETRPIVVDDLALDPSAAPDESVPNTDLPDTDLQDTGSPDTDLPSVDVSDAAGTGADLSDVSDCYDIVVRLLGPVDVVDRDNEPAAFGRAKTLELMTWLATHRDNATRGRARAALWDVDVRDATFSNVVSDARRSLGRLVPLDDGDWIDRTLNDRLPLRARVLSDADVVRTYLAAADRADDDQAFELLRSAVGFVRGMPFSDCDYLWPDAEGITSDLVLLATGVATELAQRALTRDDVDTVFWATGRGLAVLPGHEELIGLRMRAHGQRGDLAAVQREWESYQRAIDADTWSNGDPAPKLVALRSKLVGS